MIGLLGKTWPRYLIVSAISLGVDVSVFLALLGAGTPSLAASAGGYCTGIVAHWLLSSRAVFSARVAAPGAPRARQQAMFLASAVAGLAVTQSVMASFALLDLDPRLAKLVAIPLSFQLGYVLRRRVVFA
ncbi:MAG: GtrA family protein [Sphingomonadaceae bacterium]|nr:GtrA family protein [Sphingomonadaceae bacterium]